MKTIETNEAKSFPLKFSKLILWLSVGIFALCGAGIVVTVFRIVRNGGLHGFTDYLKFPFLILVCVFCIVLMICLLVKSQYVVNETHLTTQFGFIKSKFPLKDFTAMELDRDEHKLIVYSGENYMVIKVCAEWQDDFASELLKKNPDVQFSYTLTSASGDEPKNDEPKDDNK